MELSGRVALVTGGGTGLGRAISLHLARRGCHLAINYSQSSAEAEETAQLVRDFGCQALAVKADVSRRPEVEEMVRSVETSLGPVDLMVNNAGTTRYIPFPEIESIQDIDWDRILSVNLVGQFLCVQRVVPGMRERGFGKILNVASDSAFSSQGSSIPYVVSKAGVVSLTKCLARALSPVIQVNALAPGWMATRWVAKYLPPDVQQRVLSPAPGQPKLADLDDIALAGMSLLENDSISGVVLMVTRGAVIA